MLSIGGAIGAIWTQATAGVKATASWYTGNRRDARNVGNTNSWQTSTAVRTTAIAELLASARFQGR
jgi:hypothetical protein